MSGGARANRALPSYPPVCRKQGKRLRRKVAAIGPPTICMRSLKSFAPILLTSMALADPVGAQTLPGGFVFLRDIDPSILQDIRYAGTNNFVGRRLSGYEAAECVVKREVGLALQRVQRELAPQKLSLKMLDCYRPERAVHDMVVWARNGRETPAERRYNPGVQQRRICFGWAISPSIPAIPPARLST